jgi:hypothetical protein
MSEFEEKLIRHLEIMNQNLDGIFDVLYDMEKK